MPELTDVEVPLERPQSQKIYEASCQVIPKGVNSPVRSFPGLNQTPLVAHSAHGDTLVDEDGHTYIDLCCSWGPLINGHAHPRIVEAAQRRVAMGSSFGVTTKIEAQMAAKIVEHMPSIEKVRFVSSGTEAAMSAVRLARGFTKRDLIIKFSGHYHGHADAFLVQAGSGVMDINPTSTSAGVPEDFVKNTLCLPYNDSEALEAAFREHGSKLAAVILEPIAANMGLVEPKKGFLELLRELTTKHGALLIFDEVITGFRVALGGAQEYYGIEADLTCLGKIVGGGFPAAAFGGPAAIMDHLAPQGPVYQAGTLSGNPVAMEAGYQNLVLCEAPGFYKDLEEKTAEIVNPIRALIEEKGLNACIHQVGSLFTLFLGQTSIESVDDVKRCDMKWFNDYFQAMFRQGVYVSPSQYEANFVSSAHSPASIMKIRDALLSYLSH